MYHFTFQFIGIVYCTARSFQQQWYALKIMRKIHLGIGVLARVKKRRGLVSRTVSEGEVLTFLKRLKPDDVVFGYFDWNKSGGDSETVKKVLALSGHGLMIARKNGKTDRYDHPTGRLSIDSISDKDIVIELGEECTLYTPN